MLRKTSYSLTTTKNSSLTRRLSVSSFPRVIIWNAINQTPIALLKKSSIDISKQYHQDHLQNKLSKTAADICFWYTTGYDILRFWIWAYLKSFGRRLLWNFAKNRQTTTAHLEQNHFLKYKKCFKNKMQPFKEREIFLCSSEIIFQLVFIGKYPVFYQSYLICIYRKLNYVICFLSKSIRYLLWPIGK